MNITEIPGGVTAAPGFTAAAVYAGIKYDKGNAPPEALATLKPDVTLIAADRECNAAAVYTLNRVKAAPIYATMEHLENGVARAFIGNSGNANACAPEGLENAKRMCAAAARALGIREDDVLVSSTGVIGVPLPIERIEAVMPELTAKLSADGGHDAVRGLMTTDTVPKECAVTVMIGGKKVTVGGLAKGSGMIRPNMGTMLSVVTTDCAITSEMLHLALAEVTRCTFNRVSVDGDTSTNDMLCVLASGAADNEQIEWKDDDYALFTAALEHVCGALAKMIAKDGEGATRLILCRMLHARSEESAERLAMSVIGSPLVKTAMFGADANWGRVLCAMGYSHAPFRPEYVDIGFASRAGHLTVCRDGAGLTFDEALAKKVLSEDEVEIVVDLKEGDATATAMGCDLTYDYVKINGDYRT